jgi:hypothetical protein
MRWVIRSINRLLPALLRRKPAPRLGSCLEADWLPPVLGPGDWSSGMMATMADKSAAWYFDRAA